MKLLKIQFCSAQNGGTVWIRRNKNLPAPIGAISDQFFHGPTTFKIAYVFAIFLGGPMAAT